MRKRPFFSCECVRRLIALIVLAWSGAIPGSAKADLTDLSAKAARTTVYISTTFVDQKTGDTKTEIGSGFLVSAEGDILTDYHVIADWLAGTDAQKEKYPLKIRIGSKFSAEIPAVFETGDPRDDFALLRALGLSEPPFAPICFNPNVQSGSFIFAFGYPNDRELAPIPGTFNNLNGDKNRWLATIPVARGMSGGPVYNEKGFVIGLINGGADPTTSLITPIRWAKSAIENRTTARPACYRFCRTPENGVEGWGNTSPWSGTTEWLSGGHNQTEACGRLQQQYIASHPGQALDIVQTSETSQKDFLGHVTYQYICNGVVKLNPVYALKDSPACGLEQ